MSEKLEKLEFSHLQKNKISKNWNFQKKNKFPEKNQIIRENSNFQKSSKFQKIKVKDIPRFTLIAEGSCKNLSFTCFELPDDKFILNYLRGCKFSYERTKEKIDTWHSVRTHCPEFFTQWDLENPMISEMVERG